MHAEPSTIHQSDVAATMSATPRLEAVRLFCSHVGAWGGATILGCLASAPSVQRAQRQRVHQGFEGTWYGPVTVIATQEMLVRDT